MGGKNDTALQRVVLDDVMDEQIVAALRSLVTDQDAVGVARDEVAGAARAEPNLCDPMPRTRWHAKPQAKDSGARRPAVRGVKYLRHLESLKKQFSKGFPPWPPWNSPSGRAHHPIKAPSSTSPFTISSPKRTHARCALPSTASADSSAASMT